MQGDASAAVRTRKPRTKGLEGNYSHGQGVLVQLPLQKGLSRIVFVMSRRENNFVYRFIRNFALVYASLFFYGRGWDQRSRLEDLLPSLLLALLTYRQPLLELNFFVAMTAGASLLYLMDWNVWFQRFPIPTVCGALLGWLLDRFLER